MEFHDPNDNTTISSITTDHGLSEKLLGGQAQPAQAQAQPPMIQTVKVDDIESVGLYPQNTLPPNNNNHNVEAGEKQPNQYRDVWAAVLFVAQLLTIMYLALAWGIPSLNYETTSSSSSSSSYTTDVTLHFGGMLGLCILSSLASLMISAGALTFMTQNAQFLVQYSLLFSIVCDAFMVIYFILINPMMVGIVVSIIFLIITLWYARAVWRRIPFAAANLETALTAVRTNGGVTILAYGITMFVNFIFVLFWLLAWLGVYVRYTVASTCSSSSSQDDNACLDHTNPVTVFLFLLSFYWTAEVAKNILHVTVSGVVGTWWFAPDDASSFCSPAILDSFVRASTYSAGSICLGSLLTALLQVLHHLAHQARRHGGRGNDLFLCVIECLVGFLERLVAYFNKWAYVYIGLYGYDYLTAGKKVMSLFMARGWTTIINDNLVMRVLVLMSFVIGIVTGAFGLLLATLRPGWVEEFGGTGGTGGTVLAFVLPFLIGTSMSYILMGVVASAVDTVVVAFCEAPMEFERNHPGLHRQMTTAWSQVYPEEFGR